MESFRLGIVLLAAAGVAISIKTTPIVLSHYHSVDLQCGYHFIPVGGLLNLSCHSRGVHRLCNKSRPSKWEVSTTAGKNLTAITRETLVINNVTRQDSGNYSAIFTVGTAHDIRYRCLYRVKVGEPPTFVNIHTKGEGHPIGVPVGEPLRISCCSDGEPPLTFRWYRKLSSQKWEIGNESCGSEYVISMGHKNSTLLIPSFQEWDRGGKYMCKVASDFGVLKSTSLSFFLDNTPHFAKDDEPTEEEVLMLANESNDLICKSSPISRYKSRYESKDPVSHPVSWSTNCGDDEHCAESSTQRISYCRENHSSVARVRFKVVLLGDSGRNFTCWSVEVPERTRVERRKLSKIFITESLHDKKTTTSMYSTDDLDSLRGLRGRWIAVDCRARAPSGIDILLDWQYENASGRNGTKSLVSDDTRMQPFQRRQVPSRDNNVLSTLYVPENHFKGHYACVAMAMTNLSSKLSVLIRNVIVTAL